MDISEKLKTIFAEAAGGPFLFVGSGFSRRYLGLEDWKGLLGRFCVAGRPFEYYLAKADGSVPGAAAFLAEDFNEIWWTEASYAPSVERHKGRIADKTSALRVEICAYLSTLDQQVAKKSDFADEVHMLSKLNVDGVITTNWDMFLEQVFPDYKVYVGQEELLFSNTQGIGEIYKIHGSCTQPSSLVLTEQDYEGFADKNAYLAAKLMTIFVEHPVVFIGYSMADQNIKALLKAVSLCIGKEHIEKLRSNLIFVQRAPDGKEEISDTYLTIDGVQIPLVLVRANSFLPVYTAIDTTKRKIPARVLRYCKEQLYELVRSSEPEKKICVVDIDDIDRKEGVEFLVGVGVATEYSGATPNPGDVVADLGYAMISASDLLKDLLHDCGNYDSRAVLTDVIKVAGKNTKNVPVFKYMRASGIESEDAYKASALSLDKWVNRDFKEYRVTQYSAPFFRKYRHMTMREIIDACTPENASAYIPWVPREKIDLDLLRDFLVANEAKMDYRTSSYASNFRKLASLYDRLRWGWK